MDWHRLFGLVLTDFFAGSSFLVELEKDLSVQQQRLDVLILRRGPAPFPERLPDGLDDLDPHNLLTFKSHQEPLDGWALHEVISHYVSYRKLVSPAPHQLLPESDFRLYAVSARYPHNLAGRVPWQEVRPGVYRCGWGTAVIRVVVIKRLPKATHNAPLHLFAAEAERVRFGQQHYRKRSATTSTLLDQLFTKYRGEGLVMPYTMEDFLHEYVKERFKDLTPAEKQEALESLSPEEWRRALQSLPPEEWRRALQSLPPEELYQALSPEQVASLQHHGGTPGSPLPKSQGRRPGPKRRKK